MTSVRLLRSGASMTPAAVLGWMAGGALVTAALGLVRAPWPILPDVALIAHLTGLLAGYGVAVMLILMARIPALERGVGADRLARWHGLGGRTVLVLILGHGAAATEAWAQLRNIDLLTATAQVMSFPGLVAATVGTVLFVLVGIASARAARRKLSYETWHLLHLSMYVAIGLSFAHELAGPNLAGVPVVQVFWTLLYTASFGLIFRYRILDPLLRAWRHRLRVERVVREGPDAYSIVVRGRDVRDLDAEAGQFFRWRFLTAGTWRTAHPFSLSAAPSGNHLRLTIKVVGDGTTRLPYLRPGTRILAEGPYGAMTERRRSGHGVLLIAGGVGITPMRALFESLDMAGAELTLLYRASSPDEILFRVELEQIAAARGARIIYIVGSSSDPATAITADRLRAILPGVAATDVYICASPRLAIAVKSALAEAGVPRQRIHHEDFVF